MENQLKMFRHGNDYFKTNTEKEAIYQVASFLVLADTLKESLISQSENIIDEKIIEILNKAEEPLYLVTEEKTEIQICEMQDLAELKKLIRKTDIAILNKLKKMYDKLPYQSKATTTEQSNKPKAKPKK